MDKCLFCKKGKRRKKFCSAKCVKRAWYLRGHPNSYFAGSDEFWKSDTGIGFKWEKFTAKLLGAKHLEFNEGPDLDWKGKSVDVKVCEEYFPKRKWNTETGQWVFNRNNEKPLDFFFCIALKNGKPFKKFLIPSEKFANKGITVGYSSKYDEFIFE